MLSKIEKWVQILLPSKEDKDFPVHQVTYNGKTGNAIAWYMYGWFANPPSGTLARMARINSHGEQRVISPDAPKNRPAAEATECGMFHPETGTKIHLKANGDIEVSSTSDVTITVVGNVNITAVDVNIIASGDTVTESANTTIGAAGEKIAFLGATPVVKQTLSTSGTSGIRLDAIEAALIAYGLGEY